MSFFHLFASFFHRRAIGTIFPLPLEAYGALERTSAADTPLRQIVARALLEPMNVVVTLLFLAAILHIFSAGRIAAIGRNCRRRLINLPANCLKSWLFRWSARLCKLLGEMELVFLIWVLPLLIAFCVRGGPMCFFRYVSRDVSFAEPIFIFAVMLVAATKPVLDLAERILGRITLLGKGTVTAWWFSIFFFTPCFGSFVTEPAAITIASLLLARKFYELQPSPKFAYASVGLLFVCISVGGALTHFAAPPILMVARRWNWTLSHVFLHLGLRAVLGIFLSTTLYALFFRKELKRLCAEEKQKKQSQPVEKNWPLAPLWLSFVHIFFIAWLVVHLHSPLIIFCSFFLFSAIVKLTTIHQSPLRLRESLFVAVFLGGLVIHGGLQQWWIEPLFSRLNTLALFSLSAFLSAFNDNASVTYLTTLVPKFLSDVALQHAIVAGAITSGGLTIIANAPNPAGQALLRKYFPNGLSPLFLFISACPATAIMAACFLVA
ncbi:MAG: putative Na+/H+ antiporter [Puniceicoccales bacterium]|jgi:hypothetical protein|nr:putative Na+/H+ antiporter [Puniceicoccales bacterium]